jgi:hypothetical protein
VSTRWIFGDFTNRLPVLVDHAGSGCRTKIASSRLKYRRKVEFAIPVERDSSDMFINALERAAINPSRRGRSVRPSILERSLMSRWIKLDK